MAYRSKLSAIRGRRENTPQLLIHMNKIIRIRYSIELKNQIYVKDYGLFLFC